MAFSVFLGRDGTFHRFTYVKMHIARIYVLPVPQKQTMLKPARVLRAPLQ